MNERPSIEVQLALIALGEALKARAHGLANQRFLESAGVPKEALDEVYFAMLRAVTEEARDTMKESGVHNLVADTIADRLISSLPTEESAEAERTDRSN